jgi:FtsP/CotA-like multicopper oxidase with cupredoxin domain
LIVEEPYPPDVDQDVTIVLFDALSDGEGDFDREYYRSHYRTAGRIGDVLRAFGSSSSVLVGQRLRFRFINVSVDRVFRIHVQGVEGAVVALDGMPLAHLHPLEDIKLAPGQRSDVIGDVLDDVLISEVADRTPVALKTLAATGTVTRRSSEIQPLPPNNLPAPGEISLRTPIVMQGGAGAPAHGGFGTWALNDVSGLPRRPLLTVPRGTTVLLELQNDTEFPHGMHLHGHHFWETDTNEEPTVLRDTTLVGAHEVRMIICVLDNPGAWLVHCHMLSHQEDGMASWIAVT